MLRAVVVVAVSLAAMSCATIAHGTHETLSIDSTPSGANVQLKCQELSRAGTTPARIVVPRNAADCVATISKDGYKTKSVSIERLPSRPYWLNFVPLAAGPIGFSDNSPVEIGSDAGLALLLSGIVGLAVDAFDGAMFRHEPTSVSVALDPAP